MSSPKDYSKLELEFEEDDDLDDVNTDLVELNIETTTPPPTTGRRDARVYVPLGIGIAISLGVIFVLSASLLSPEDPPPPPPFTTNSRIAIIGAGVSGIHMAYILKNMGYNNVVLFEKELKPGGNAKSLQVNGTWYDLGVSVTTGFYKRTRKLIEKYSLTLSNSLKQTITCDIQNATQRSNNTQLSRSEAFKKWLYFYDKYISLNGNNSYIFPAKVPSDEMLQIFAMPLGQFVRANKMDAMSDIFSKLLKIYSYGDYETLPTYYAFDLGTDTNTLSLIEGMGNLFAKMTTGMEIRTGVEIRKVNRNNGKIGIIFQYRNNSVPVEEEFDFLILACGLPHTTDWLDLYPEELEIFRYYSPNPPEWTTTVLTTPTWSSDFRICVPPRKHFSGLIAYYPENSETRAIYQVTNDLSDTNASEVLYQSLSYWYNITQTDTTLQARCQLSYSPTFTPDGIINKIPWKVWDLQGKYKTWYIGASVSFDLVEVVVDYNQQLVDRWLGTGPV